VDIGARIDSAVKWLSENLIGVVKFSFGWLGRSDDRMLFLKLLAVQFVGVALLLISLFVLLGGAVLKGGLAVALLSMGVVAALVSIVILLAIAIIVAYFQPLAMLGAMKEKKLATVKWGMDKFFGSIILAILTQITVLLFWFNRKWLVLYVPAILGIALAAAGAFMNISALTIAGILLFAVAMVALAVMWVYTGFKLSLCFPAYLSRECGYMEALETSWNLTENRVLELFISSVLFGLLLAAVVMVVSVPASFLAMGVGVVERIAYNADILGQSISQVIQLVTTLFSVFCTFGFYAAVYALFKAEKAGASKAAAAPAKKQKRK